MWTKVIMFAVTSGLAAQALRLWIEREHERRAARERTTGREALQRWEDEGGTLAAGAAPHTPRADQPGAAASRARCRAST